MNSEKKFNFKEGESPLKQIRDALNLSQEGFGRLIGVSYKTISRWELGLTEPSFTVPQLKRLQEAIQPLGLHVLDLPDQMGPTANQRGDA